MSNSNDSTVIDHYLLKVGTWLLGIAFTAWAWMLWNIVEKVDAGILPIAETRITTLEEDLMQLEDQFYKHLREDH